MTKILIDEATVKLALEALEYIEHNYMSLPAPAEKAITALREALTSVPDWASEAKEQPAPVAKPHEQEPVAWRYTDARGHYRYRGFVANFDKKYPMLKPQPLYTSPIAQQEPFQNNPFDCGVYLGSGKDHVIKHHVSYGPAQQEPVAWTNWRELVGARHYRTPGWEMYADKRNPDDVAIYTSPPAQRTWVGLTPEQAVDLYKATETDNRMVLIDAVEAKLRSKNEDRN